MGRGVRGEGVEVVFEISLTFLSVHVGWVKWWLYKGVCIHNTFAHYQEYIKPYP